MFEPAVEVLLVEDNPTDAELMLHILKKFGLIERVYHVHDGAEAIDFLAGMDATMLRSLKVIFLDLKLPRLDGMDVLRNIRKDERFDHIPVVVLTSSQEASDIEGCYRLGANSFIVKPVDFDLFSEAIQQLVAYWLSLNRTRTIDRGVT